MAALLRTELTRLRWRRAVLVLLAAAVLAPALVLGAEVWNTRSVSGSERRAAEIDLAEHQQMVEEEVERCVRRPERYGVEVDAGMTTEGVAARCQDWVWGAPPTVEDFLHRPALTPGYVAEGSGIAVVVILAVGALLVGATFVGQDWASGSISNQLLFEPRRGRVWTAKALAVLLWSAATGAVVLALYWAVVWAVGSSRDVPVEAGAWSDALQMQGRAVLLVAGAGLLGYALTTLFRSTVASLGVVVGVVVLGTIVPLAVLGSGVEPWLLPMNAAAFLQDGYQYWVIGDAYDQVCTSDGVCTGDDGSRILSLAHGATYLATLLAAGLASSLWSFRSRDLP